MAANTNSIIYEDTNATKEFLCLLDQRRREKQFCDVILIAEGEEFPAHKIILACASPYFNKMFEPESGFSESTQKRIEINEIKSEVLREIIEFSYTRKVNINEENAQLLYAASHLLQYKSLLEICLRIIWNQFNIENCLHTLLFARLYDEVSLRDAISAFVGNNLSEIINGKAFLELNYDQLVYILNRTEIIFQNDELLVGGIINWVNDQKVERETHFIDLMKYVRMDNLSVNHLTTVVSNEPMMVNVECYQMIIDAYKSHNSLKYKLIGLVRDAMFSYNVEHVRWDIETKLPSFKNDYGTAVLDNKLYILGGTFNNEPTNMVDMYDPNTNSWTSMTPMLFNRSRVKANVLNGKIYVVGGFNGEVLLKSAEVFDPETNQWTPIPDMFSEDVLTVQTSDNILYAIGTFKQTGKRCVQTYDPQKGNWTIEEAINVAQPGIFMVEKGKFVAYATQRNACINTRNATEKYIGSLPKTEFQNILDNIDCNNKDINCFSSIKQLCLFCLNQKIAYTISKDDMEYLFKLKCPK